MPPQMSSVSPSESSVSPRKSSVPPRSELTIALAIVVAAFGLGWGIVATLSGPADSTPPLPLRPASSVESSPPPAEIPAPGPLFAMIAGRNLTVVALLVSGLFTFGFMSASVLAYNGFALGGLVRNSLAMGMEPIVLAGLILPHGVLELTAFVLAGAIGLRGWSLGRHAMRSGRWEFVGVRTTVTVSVAAVMVAAVIEATITRHILLSAASR